SRVLINVINLSGKSYDFRLRGSAKNNDGSLSMDTKDDAAVPSIHINPHESKQLNLNDFRVFDPNSVRFKGTNVTIIARTHLLPDGVYSLCVQALEYKSHAILSPEQCASFQITNADAPMLLLPSHKSAMDPRSNPMVQFQWIPPVQAPATAVYELEMLELPPNMEPEAAFRMPQSKRFKREVRSMNMMQVQSGELQLEQGKTYAWRVKITDPMNTMAFRNDGYSPAWSFKYGGDIGVVIKPKVKMPDTLISGGGFAIVVQSWDDTSKSFDKTLPSGTGCIKFDCTKKKKIIPPYWDGLLLEAKTFNIVGSGVSDSLKEMHVMDAKMIDKNLNIGDKLSLDLPSSSISRAAQLSDLSKYLDLFKTKLPAGCILVAFHDVKWTPPNKSSVVLTSGVAVYPTTPATPAPPALLQLDSGFMLAMDSIIVTPSEATVQGKVLLPLSIISADTCTRAFVKLPKTTISSNCEFYKEVIASDSGFGKWWIGNTGILLHGNKYIVDFSSSQSPAGYTPALASAWKGIALVEGANSDAPTGTMVSNRGYIKAPYTFNNAIIVTTGFQGILKFPGPSWKFTTLEPYGYQVELTKGLLGLDSSKVRGGGFINGTIALPLAAIRDMTGSQARTNYTALVVRPDMSLFGEVKYQGGFQWGEFSRTAGVPRYYILSAAGSGVTDSGSFYLSAAQIKPYYPADSNWHSPILVSPMVNLPPQRMQGVTFPFLNNRSFTIVTPDVPMFTKQVQFKKEVVFGAWMNIIRTGVHAEVDIICDSTQEKDYQLGDSLRVKYNGKTS
ncbi:MAG: hypothetical protein ABI778_11375, partial [Ignavibacteriota bacterium]